MTLPRYAMTPDQYFNFGSVLVAQQAVPSLQAAKPPSSRERCARSRCCKRTPAPLPIPLSQPGVGPPAEATDEPAHRQAARYVRALLLARIYEMLVAIALLG